jgi:hypothetical protein
MSECCSCVEFRNLNSCSTSGGGWLVGIGRYRMFGRGHCYNGKIANIIVIIVSTSGEVGAFVAQNVFRNALSSVPHTNTPILFYKNGYIAVAKNTM